MCIRDRDLPLYPVQVFSSELKSANQMKVNGEVKHVLEYHGDKNFTVVETKKEVPKDTQTVIMPGEMIDAMDVVGFYDGNHMSVVYDGVEFSVFSDELGPEEMMAVSYTHLSFLCWFKNFMILVRTLYFNGIRKIFSVIRKLVRFKTGLLFVSSFSKVGT